MDHEGRTGSLGASIVAALAVACVAVVLYLPLVLG
jgi:hypothetical protein